MLSIKNDQEVRIMRRKVLIFSTMMILGFVCIFSIACTNSQVEDRLSQEEIEGLRNEYPIYNNVAPYVEISREMTLEEVSDVADTFIYGKIKGEAFRRSDNTGTGIPELDDKLNDKGGFESVYAGYTLEVLNDTEGMLKKGSLVTIEVNEVFWDMMPNFSDGMEVIVPVTSWANTGNLDRYNFTRTGMFYVTEDDYALAVYQDDNDAITGMKVDPAMTAIQDLAHQK